jgi:hypothetical protein
MPKKKTSKTNEIKKTKIKKEKNKKENDNIIEIKEKIIKKPRVIREKTELIHNNPSQSNEAIIKTIVDKIINLSVRQSFINSINKRLEDYYFDYAISQVNTLFATNNIYYYDEPEIEQCNNKQLFWNKNYEVCNTWVELTEPNTSKCDRCENAFMNYINYTYKSTKALPSEFATNNTENDINEKGNNKDNLNDIKMKNIKNFHMNIHGIKSKESNMQILDILEEKSSFSSDEENKEIKNKKINLNKTRNTIKNKTINKNKIKKENKANVFSKTNVSNKKMNFDDNKKNKKQPVPEMNNKEIPEIDKEYNYERYDPPDVSLLRKEMQEETIKKEIEEKKKARKKITMTNIKKEIIENVETNNKNKKKYLIQINFLLTQMERL